MNILLVHVDVLILKLKEAIQRQSMDLKDPFLESNFSLLVVEETSTSPKVLPQTLFSMLQILLRNGSMHSVQMTCSMRTFQTQLHRFWRHMWTTNT